MEAAAAAAGGGGGGGEAELFETDGTAERALKWIEAKPNTITHAGGQVADRHERCEGDL